MKKCFAALLSFALAVCLLAAPAWAAAEVAPGYDYGRLSGAGITLNVYNWGQYISDGSDDTMDVIAEFEALTGIDVNYTTFASNEEMYTKIKTGGADYDVIIPSDYMIGRMSREGLLAKVDYANIPNAAAITDTCKGWAFDPESTYSVPYMWGTVGIVYNKTMVDKPVDSWAILWDEDYAGQILMFNNSRDAFGIALKMCGLSMNPASAEDIDAAAALLKQQKGLVSSYVMDEIYDKMEGGEAAAAPYYAGDAIVMMRENTDLAFAHPKEGVNYYVDAMCIPASCQNKEAAEMFINFMCETDIGLANAIATGYSTPLSTVYEVLPADMKDSTIVYPGADVMSKAEVFDVLPDDINTAMDAAWSDIRSYDEAGSRWLVPVLLVAAVAIIVIIVVRRAAKRKREDY